MVDKIRGLFMEAFGQGEEEVHIYFAPGRVNLIGEHTDYNHGFVLPCALSFGTYLAIRKTNRMALEFKSTNFPLSVDIPWASAYHKSGGDWINYPLGVMEMFNLKGYYTSGLQMLYSGDIPPAAGLSSSASIEMVTAFALNDLFGWSYSMLDLVHLCRKAENEFVGVNCGIMDMFAVGLGRKDHAIFLNCGTLAYQHVPAVLPGYRLVITNTNKKRGLADSKYNERVGECRQAVEYLSRNLDIRSLGDISFGQFLELQAEIPDLTVRKRARHVVSENQRVLESVKALLNNDLEEFGRLMVRSHDSLRDDYEVTGFELDALVDIILDQEGVLGARMTGAGFGGCTVAFVRENSLEEFKMRVDEQYKMKTGLKPDFYLPDIADGVNKLDDDTKN